jgi:hypothetical protein
MKPGMRRELACQPFEEKIRKVGQLIRLSATLKSSRVREEPPRKRGTSSGCPTTEGTSVDSKL